MLILFHLIFLSACKVDVNVGGVATDETIDVAAGVPSDCDDDI